jgi:hypothetical protein
MNLTDKSLSELVKLYNSLKPKIRVKRFASKGSAIKRINGLMAKKAQDKAMKKRIRMQRIRGTGSKVSIVRQMFAVKNSWTREEISEKSGFDWRNTHTAMSILKNPKRTKDLLPTVYDRATRTYTLVARSKQATKG